MNPSKLLLAILFSSVLASSGYQSSPLSKEDVFQVSRIIEKGKDHPDKLDDLFDDRRLIYSRDAKHLL